MKELKLVSTNITTYYYDKLGEESKIMAVNPNFKVEGDNYTFDYISAKTGRNVTIHAIIIGEKFHLHHTDMPAMSVPENDEYIFVLYGHNVKVEHLPCEDEVKVCLKLKYSENYTESAWKYQ